MENKNVTLKNGQNTNYFELITACLNGQAAKGISIGQMRYVIKVIDLFDNFKLATSILLTPSQLAIVQKSVEEMQWAIIDPALVEMYDYILSLK